MGKDKTKQFLLGAASLTLGGVDLGYAGKNGIQVKATFKEIPGLVSDFGDMPVNMWGELSGLEIDVELQQTDLTLMQSFFAQLTKITSAGAANKQQIGQYAGTQLTAAQLIITPLDSTLATLCPLTIYRVVPVAVPEFMYQTDAVQVWKVKFKALADESKSNGNWIGTFGDTSVVADAVAPTISAVSPADAATGVATSAVVVWTVSKALDSSTVTPDSVLLMLTPFSVGTPTALGIAGTVAVVNSGASTTITFTPSSALTGSKSYVAVLTSSIKDLAGNRLGGGSTAGKPVYTTDFATA